MPYFITERVTEPTAAQEPVSVELFADHAKLDLDLESPELMALYIASARGYCEKYTNRAWAPGTFRGRITGYCRAPLYLATHSVPTFSSVTVTDSEGTELVLPATDFVWSQSLNELRIINWNLIRPWASVNIEYELADVYAPPAVVHAILIVAADMYANRETELPAQAYTNRTAERLLQMHRTGLSI